MAAFFSPDAPGWPAPRARPQAALRSHQRGHLFLLPLPATSRAAEVFAVADPEGDVLTVEEAARLLRVNRKTLYASISAGEVPAARVGGTIRLSRTALLRYLEGNGSPALGVNP